jgi:hypothetical protein
MASYTSLPQQKLPASKKDKEWREANIDYYERLSFLTTTGNRTSNFRKLINYDLFNGKFNIKDLEYVYNPFAYTNENLTFPASMQHYDIISPSLMSLIGEEIKRADNFRVVAEDADSISRKERMLTEKIKYLLKEQLMSEIDPENVDPNNKPTSLEELIKYEKYNSSDYIEITANKMLAYLKRNLNTKYLFSKGWKDALIAGEEIYWTGISNGEPIARRCNPPDITVVLDGDSDFIDDAIAVVETRLLSPATILDEYGDELKSSEIDELEELVKSISSRGTAIRGPLILPQFSSTDPGYANFNNTTNGEVRLVINGLIRVVRVEWMSMEKVGILKYPDENGQIQEVQVDETFKLTPELKEQGWEVEWFWINEPWEGIKIGDRIYTAIRPKVNQRRKLDNPYYSKLGYSGLIYNATNSVSVSFIDRMKPYQYLYNILMYRLELAFASDMGKIFLMDLAQIPRSEGIDLDQWMYYLKAMKIGFINSHEEGKRGSRQGHISNFNQFQSIDMSLSNTIQQYINSLEYIKNQVSFLTGISAQRLGEIQASEGVGNVNNSLAQSSNITEYYFNAHDEVKRRVYTSLLECAKIAWREGKKVQYVLDDLGIELLNIDGLDMENTELGVFLSNSQKDKEVIDTLKGLFQSALQSDKANLSDIASVIGKDSIQEITKLLEQREKEKLERDQQNQQQQLKVEQDQITIQNKIHEEQLADKQSDRELQQYIADTNNATKIQVAEIGALSFAENKDTDNNGVPDVIEQANLSLKERDLASKSFMEQQKLSHEKDKHSKEIQLKEKEMKQKADIENKKIEAIRVQNQSQEKMQSKKIEADKELANKKLAIEKIKARNKPKPKSK